MKLIKALAYAGVFFYLVVIAITEYKTREQKRKFYRSKDWKSMRKAILERDNYECQICKEKGLVTTDTNEYSYSAKRKKIQLIVHHIKELEHYPELALDPDNLQTVCVSCHERIHGRLLPEKYTKRERKWDDEKW